MNATTKSKKILIIGQIPPPYGGQAINIQKLISVLEKHSFHFRTIPLQFSDSLSEMGKWNFRKIIRIIKTFLKLSKELIIFQPDIVYYPPAGPTTNAVYRDFILLFPIRFFHYKRLFHFHAGGIATLFPNLPNWAKQLYKYVYFDAEYALCLSESGKIDPLFLQSKNISIIPTGVSNCSDSSNQLSIVSKKESFIVLFAGLCSQSKGIIDFIEILRKCNQQNPNIIGYVIGNIQSEKEKIQINKAEKEGCIVYKGIVTGKDKELIFLQSSVLLFPSKFESENFPTVILEAFSVGMPVVSTYWRGIPDIITDGVTGFLHTPQNIESMTESIISLAHDKELYAKMSAMAKTDFENKYTMATFEKLTVDYFNQLL